jgi:hypothetical protein
MIYSRLTVNLINNLNIPTDTNRNRSLLCKCIEIAQIFITIPSYGNNIIV